MTLPNTAVTSVCALAAAAALTGTTALATSGKNISAMGHEIVLSGLENPWDMAFLPDGTMFYTEKCKGLSVRKSDGSTAGLLGMGETDDYAVAAEDLFCEGQAGMQGVAVDPNFAENRTIYVYSTSNMATPHTNRVLKMTVSEDLSTVSDRVDIVTDINYKMAASDHPFGGPGAHNGGRIRFNPGDGFLYVTTGDTHNGAVPQSGTDLGGKVLRINTDGNAAPGNNEIAGFDPRIYTYGHRNIQGISFHPVTFQPIIAEHGPWHSDEITALVPGGNGGWDPRPNVHVRGDCNDDYCGYLPNQGGGMNRFERASFMPMTDLETYPDAMQPMWDNNSWSQGTSSAEFLTGSQWGDWENAMVVGIMGIGFGGTPIGQRIDVIELSDDGQSVVDVTEMTLPMEAGRFRSVVQGPDGALYTAVDQGIIHKLVP
ncbi:MAG: PQQ-dependent sugar dehydrogenase [Pseudomonadota bacterium]